MNENRRTTIENRETRLNAKAAVAAGKFKLPVPASAFMPLPGVAPISIAEARGCRWPVSCEADPVMGLSSHVCGGRRAPGASYCNHHARMSRGRGTASERDALKVLARAAG